MPWPKERTKTIDKLQELLQVQKTQCIIYNIDTVNTAHQLLDAWREVQFTIHQPMTEFSEFSITGYRELTCHLSLILMTNTPYPTYSRVDLPLDSTRQTLRSSWHQPPRALRRHCEGDFVWEGALATRIGQLHQILTVRQLTILFLNFKACKDPLEILHNAGGEAGGICITIKRCIRGIAWHRQPYLAVQHTTKTLDAPPLELSGLRILARSITHMTCALDAECDSCNCTWLFHSTIRHSYSLQPTAVKQ